MLLPGFRAVVYTSAGIPCRHVSSSPNPAATSIRIYIVDSFDEGAVHRVTNRTTVSESHVSLPANSSVFVYGIDHRHKISWGM